MKRRWMVALSAGVATAGFALAIPAAHALDVCVPRCGIIQAAEGSSIEPNPDNITASVFVSLSVEGRVVVARGASVSSASIVNSLPGVVVTHDGPGPEATVVNAANQAVATVGATAALVTNTIGHSDSGVRVP